MAEKMRLGLVGASVRGTWSSRSHLPAAQPGYFMGIRIERYIAEGLRKLGCGGA